MAPKAFGTGGISVPPERSFAQETRKRDEPFHERDERKSDRPDRLAQRIADDAQAAVRAAETRLATVEARILVLESQASRKSDDGKNRTALKVALITGVFVLLGGTVVAAINFAASVKKDSVSESKRGVKQEVVDAQIPIEQARLDSYRKGQEDILNELIKRQKEEDSSAKILTVPSSMVRALPRKP